MVPMRFFRSPAFSSGIAASFLLSPRSMPPCSSCRVPAGGAGLRPAGRRSAVAARTATLFLVAPLAGALVNRIGERPLIVGGLLLQAAGMAWIAFIAAPDVTYAKLVAPLIVAGAGVSMAMPAARTPY